MLLYLDKYLGLDENDTLIRTDWYIFNTSDVSDLSTAIWSSTHNSANKYAIHAPNYVDVKYGYSRLHYHRTDGSFYVIEPPVNILEPTQVEPDIYEIEIHSPRIESYTDSLHSGDRTLRLTFKAPYPKTNVLKHLTVFVSIDGVFKAKKQSTSTTITIPADDIYKGELESGAVDIVAYYTNTNNVTSEPFEFRVAIHNIVYTGPKVISTETDTVLSFTGTPSSIKVISDHDIVPITNSTILAGTLQDGVTYFIEATFGNDVITYPIKTTSLNSIRTINPDALTHFTYVQTSKAFTGCSGLYEQMPNGNIYDYKGKSISIFNYKGEFIGTELYHTTSLTHTSVSTIASTPTKLYVNSTTTKTNIGGITEIDIVNTKPIVVYSVQVATTNGRGQFLQVTPYGLSYDKRSVFKLITHSIVINLNNKIYSDLVKSSDKINYLFQPNALTVVVCLTSIILVFDIPSLSITAVIGKHFTLDSNMTCTLADGRCVVFDVVHGKYQVLDIVAETLTQHSMGTGVGIIRHTNDTFTILR